MRSLSVVVLVVGIAVLCSLPLQAKTYYVSYSSGNDNWDGTSATHESGSKGPWKTLQKVSYVFYPNTPRVLQPGDEILLKRGDVWDGLDPNALSNRLMLNGSGDPWKSDGQWITVSAYGIGARPVIKNPPKDFTTGIMVGWEEVREKYPLPDPRWHDDSIEIAIIINGGDGWKFKGIEITGEPDDNDPSKPGGTEIGIYHGGEPWNEYGGNRHYGYWIEDCDFNNICGMMAPYAEPWYTESLGPFYGAALFLPVVENLTVKDCTFYGCSSFITGNTMKNALIENCWMYGSEATAIAYWQGVHDLTIKNCTIDFANWRDDLGHQGSWFGQNQVNFTASVNCSIDTCDLGRVYPNPTGVAADSSIFSTEGSVNLLIQNSFFHDCAMVPLEISCGFFETGSSAINRWGRIYNNVFYRGGDYLVQDPNNPMPSFWDMMGAWKGAHDFSIWNNTIYRSPMNPEYPYICFLGFYTDPDPNRHAGYFDDFEIPNQEQAGSFSVGPSTPIDPKGGDTNIWKDTAVYELPMSQPSPNPPGVNLASSATVTASSGDGAKAADGIVDAAHEWVSAESYPWIQYTWDSNQTIGTVRIFDRFNLTNWIEQARIELFKLPEDSVPFKTIFVYGGILNTGRMREVKFAPQSGVQKLKVTASYVKNNIAGAGLAELQVYAQGTVNPSVPTQDGVDRTVSFSSSPTGIRTGIYPTATDFGDGDDGIDWANADWQVIDTCGVQGKVLSIFDTMISSRHDTNVPATEYPREGIMRTFTLPRGDMLKRIRVLFPPSNTGGEDPNCYITFSQSGNPPYTVYGNGNPPQWRTIDLTTDPPEGFRWSVASTSGNIVTLTISAYGYRRTDSGSREFPRIGIGSFQFDDITYGN